jgi:hypothetical protein
MYGFRQWKAFKIAAVARSVDARSYSPDLGVALSRLNASVAQGRSLENIKVRSDEEPWVPVGPCLKALLIITGVMALKLTHEPVRFGAS